jgi:1-deoxy-D-xylulose-5-phosphate reductoisomerase
VRRIVVIGSTGSIGIQTAQVVREHPDEFRIVGIAAARNAALLGEQIREFRPEIACLAAPDAGADLPEAGPGTRVERGAEGVIRAATWPSADLVVAASSGSSALVPVLEAIRAGKDVAIANKEILVMAGGLVMAAARARGVNVLPIDSEHSAIFQCLGAADRPGLKRILLTGSGGPLRDVPASAFRGISKERVLAHPKWNMGAKVTVDSATLMNKGLETIEAAWLFGVTADQVRIVIHPEAVVHSMVEFVDGSILAQLGPTDMKSPIRYALGYPRRLAAPEGSIDLARLGSLHFMEPDERKFPCLGLAREAARAAATTLPAALSAADEIAVEAFLAGRIDFTDIPRILEKVMRSHRPQGSPGLEAILATDRWAREEARRLAGTREAGVAC